MVAVNPKGKSYEHGYPRHSQTPLKNPKKGLWITLLFEFHKQGSVGTQQKPGKKQATSKTFLNIACRRWAVPDPPVEDMNGDRKDMQR